MKSNASIFHGPWLVSEETLKPLPSVRPSPFYDLRCLLDRLEGTPEGHIRKGTYEKLKKKGGKRRNNIFERVISTEIQIGVSACCKSALLL